MKIETITECRNRLHGYHCTEELYPFSIYCYECHRIAEDNGYLHLIERDNDKWNDGTLDL